MPSASGADRSGEALDADPDGVGEAGHVDRYQDARRRYRRSVIGIALSAVIAALAVVVGSLPDSSDSAWVGSSTWGRPVLLVTGGLIVVLGGVAAVRLRTGSRRAWSSLMKLERDERRSVQRQVQGREPVDPARLVLLRTVARMQRAQWPTVVWSGGFFLINVSNLLDESSLLVAILSGVAVLLLVAGLLFTLLQYVVLATRFLRDHPEAAGAEHEQG